MKDHEIERSKIGLRIKLARAAKGMTQSTLAKAIGVNRVTVTKYENGSITPPIKTLRKIAQALDIDISEIVKNEDAVSSYREDLLANYIEVDNAQDELVRSMPLNDSESMLQLESMEHAKSDIEKQLISMYRDSRTDTNIIKTSIPVDDLTENEIAELLRFKEYLIFRRHSDEQEK